MNCTDASLSYNVCVASHIQTHTHTHSFRHVSMDCTLCVCVCVCVCFASPLPEVKAALSVCFCVCPSVTVPCDQWLHGGFVPFISAWSHRSARDRNRSVQSITSLISRIVCVSLDMCVNTDSLSLTHIHTHTHTLLCH